MNGRSQYATIKHISRDCAHSAVTVTVSSQQQSLWNHQIINLPGCGNLHSLQFSGNLSSKPKLEQNPFFRSERWCRRLGAQHRVCNCSFSERRTGPFRSCQRRTGQHVPPPFVLTSGTRAAHPHLVFAMPALPHVSLAWERDRHPLQCLAAKSCPEPCSYFSVERSLIRRSCGQTAIRAAASASDLSQSSCSITTTVVRKVTPFVRNKCAAAGPPSWLLLAGVTGATRGPQYSQRGSVPCRRRVLGKRWGAFSILGR